MARYEHLRLVRLPEQLPRRSQGGGGQPPQHDVVAHSSRLGTALDQAIDEQRQRRRPNFVDPSLILRVQMAGAFLQEAEWEKLGLTVLSSDLDRTLVLFSSSDDLGAFRERLAAYSRGTPVGQVNPSYAGFIANIDSIGSVEPRDRIGFRLREEGFTALDDFLDGEIYVLDLEIWDLGSRKIRENKIQQINDYVQEMGADVLDRYIGPSISMLRVRGAGPIIRSLLTVEDVAEIDLPPRPDVTADDIIQLDMGDLPSLDPIDDRAPLIGVIDSGVNAHPLIDDILVAAIGVPSSLGTADEWGHGTRVGGVAVFGDLRGQLEIGTLRRGARLCSAKVVNDEGKFDDYRLVPTQMREAITTLHRQYGCRIFVSALADSRHPYSGGKVGTWAATLDELARELDVVIIVAAGNRCPRAGSRLEQAVTEYPDYLLEPTNRLYEPAGAINVLTVGAIAHGEGVDDSLAEHLYVRPITLKDEPSPFTRVGPGVGNAIKPDLIDYGGTMVYDPAVGELRKGENLPSAGIVTLHHRFFDQLFITGSGTSYAAPLVAFKTSQILGRFPNASANLIRALLAGAASIPSRAEKKLVHLDENGIRAICGYGQVDLERAAYSDDARVVLYAEDSLPIDHFAVYQIPVPEPFQSQAGRRSIRVTLAFDPPVRHSRKDYIGVGMSFRLIRGCDSHLIFEHFRKRTKAEGKFPEIAKKYNCDLVPGPQIREKSTLQTAAVTFARSVENYGGTYYLVVRCEGGWASDHLEEQRFAVVVEMSHEAEIQIYQRIRQRLQV